jgi:hypothetical protein
MRENPLRNALAFLVATDKFWFTVVFWLLILGSVAVAFVAWQADPAQRTVRHLEAAVAVAREQGARAFESRAALSLAQLYQSTGRAAEAHAILTPALEGFSPTPEFPEMAEARALLDALAKEDRVREALGNQQHA